MVLFMTTTELVQAVEWEHYNSSLLIEVKRPNGVFTCTGVAVSKDIILTAAHCLDGKVDRVRIFTQDHYDPEQDSFDIKEFKLHPLYNPENSRYKADLAKISLRNPLPSAIEIHPIYKGKKISGNLLRFGFGARDNQNVRTVATPVLRNLKIEEEVIELNDEFSKSGDSGGPIFMQQGNVISLLAIHSTFSFGPEGNYSLNPLLAAYILWIFAH